MLCWAALRAGPGGAGTAKTGGARLEGRAELGGREFLETDLPSLVVGC